MMNKKTAVVIRHVAFEDLGNLLPVLQARDYAISYLEAGVDRLDSDAVAAADLLVVLGGPIGAYDDNDYPFLIDELKVLSARLRDDLPTLGICLGAQLMARALGGKVHPGGNGKEIGWYPISLTDAAADSPLRHLASEGGVVLHWHGDTFELPSGATHLVKSEKYPNQAFSFGKRALALQFHPEASARSLERWFIGHACELGGVAKNAIQVIREDGLQHSDAMQRRANKLWNEWLDIIAV